MAALYFKWQSYNNYNRSCNVIVEEDVIDVCSAVIKAGIDTEVVKKNCAGKHKGSCLGKL